MDVERMVNEWIREAWQRGASDLHFEPTRGDSLRVRRRVDGMLQQVQTVDGARRIFSRLKLMAHLDVNEKNACLDGRISYSEFGGTSDLDLRLNTTPCMGGEKIVLRLIDNRRLNTSLEDLGFTPQMLASYRELTSSPHGLVLHVGPTGSGKTTSLYALMKTLNKSEANVQTVEDPVEYDLQGVTQTQVNTELGLTFPKVLRSLLRQDPDVIMVGEIRDEETAEIATEAAMTGHLVLSTLHTNDAVGTVVRLLDMGIAPFCIAYALRVVVSQRFVRRLCTKCRRKTAPTAQTLKLMGKRPVYHAASQGCTSCHRTGYKGRVPLFELLPMTAALKKSVYEQLTPDELNAVARRNGLISLMKDGLDKVATGTTSLEEVLRVAKGVRDPRSKTGKLRRPPQGAPGRPQPARTTGQQRRPRPR